jgi:Mitotic checkpoint protein PRCC_Cterm.
LLKINTYELEKGIIKTFKRIKYLAGKAKDGKIKRNQEIKEKVSKTTKEKESPKMKYGWINKWYEASLNIKE